MIASTGVVEWQPFVSLTTNDAEVIQDESLWLDTAGCKYVVLQVLVTRVNANYFYIETSESLEGPWTTVGGDSVGRFAASATGAREIVLSRDVPLSNPYSLRRYLRWRSGDNAKIVSFRIRAELKQ